MTWSLGRTSLIALALLGGAALASAREGSQHAVSVALKDGSTLVGHIVAQDETSLTFATSGGLETKIERALVASVRDLEPAERPPDPNYSRLMLAPSARPLAKGDGYFSDHYVLFPGFGYGITNHWTVGGGASVIPGLGLNEQLFYGLTQVGVPVGRNAHLAAGALYASGGNEEFGVGMLYGVGTFGSPDRSLTIGLGWPGIHDRDEPFHFGDRPIVLVGGTVRLSRRVALVSENWILPGEPLSSQPLGLAVRLISGRLSVDVGVIVVGEALDEGLPVPWLSFAYHFGPSRTQSAQVDPQPRRVPMPRLGASGSRP